MASLPVAVLGTASPAQEAILAHLSLRDKLRVAASCTALYGSSLAWFQEADVVVTPTVTDVAAVAAWLHKHGARANVLLFLPPSHPGKLDISQEEVCACLSAMPAGLVASLAAGHYIEGLQALLPTSALARLTHLTSLELSWRSSFYPTGYVASLWPLTALRRLQLDCAHCTGGWLGLAALSRLQHLEMNCRTEPPFEDLPAGLSTLTALTFLSLVADEDAVPENAIRAQHLQRLSLLQHLGLDGVVTSDDVAAALPALPALTYLYCCAIDQHPAAAAVSWHNLCRLTALQELSLSRCRIQQLPSLLPQLTALTRLSIESHDCLALLALLPDLRQLECLELCCCDLAAVPEELSAVTALTRLDLSENDAMAGGWQHLRPLTRLRELNLSSVPLPNGVPPEVSALPELERLLPITLRP